MGWLEESIDVLLGSRTLDLRVISWRQTLHGASRGASGKHPDDRRIELRCRLDQSALEDGISVGENPTEAESLRDIEFSLELRSAQKATIEFDKKNSDTDEGKNAVGILMYNAPISPDGLAGLPSRVIEEAKTGRVNGWIFYGDNSLAEISRFLMTEPRPEIRIWATVKAASRATPLSLTYERKMHNRISYRWDAKSNPLEITEARVVVTTAGEPAEDTEIPEPIEGSPISSVSEAIAGSIRSLDTKVGRWGFIIVVFLGALLIELSRRF